MIIVKVKEGENIDRALRRFKRKFERTGVIKQIRARQAFKKPSEVKRDQMQKAIYIEQIRRNADA
ncbi:MAG: 30S ribosomal protein S21 [Bacteroidales bacterium]|nr:30S ribosomal protein S21 [Bacteroidales bacterium]